MIKTRGISQEEVFNVASKIAANGTMPTTASIRAELGRGSETTLHKYLQEWKARLLKHAARISQNSNLSLLDENKLLRSNVESLSENLQVYSQDLLNLEQKSASLLQENSGLKSKLQEHALMLVNLNAQNTSMQELLDKLSSERAEIIEQILADKNRLIESLRDELQQLQTDAIEKIRDYSFKDRDLLIAEQIKNQNLELELKRMKAIIDNLPNDATSSSQCKPVVKSARAQLLSEVYALKNEGVLDSEDDDAASI